MLVLRRSLLGLLCLCLLIGLSAPEVRALVEPSELAAMRATIDSDPAIAAEPRKGLELAFKQIEENLQRIEETRRKGKEFEQSLSELPPETRRVVAELKRLERNPPASPDPQRFDSPGRADLALQQAQSRLGGLEGELQALQARLNTEMQRPTAIRKELETLSRSQQTNGAAATADLPARYGVIDRWLQETRGSLMSSQQVALEKELLSHPVRLDALRAQLDLKALELDLARRDVGVLEDVVARLRSDEAAVYQAQARQALEDIRDGPALLQEIAEDNLALGNRLADIEARTAVNERALDEVERTVQRLEEDFTSTRQKIDVAGLSQALGQFLLEERRRLLSLAAASATGGVGEDQIARAGLEQIQHEEEYRRLRNPRAHAMMLTEKLSASDREALLETLLTLLENRKVLVERLLEADRRHLQVLGDLDFAQRQRAQQILAYRDYITERLLWIRSAPALNLDLLMGVPGQLFSLVSHGEPSRLMDDLQRMLAQHWVLGAVLMLGAGVFLRERRSLRRQLVEAAVPLRRLTTDRFGFTLKALAISVVLALPGAVLLGLLALGLQRTEGLGRLASALVPALHYLALQWFVLSLLRQLTRTDGVLRAHFKWSGTTVDRLQQTNRQLFYLFTPALAVALFLINHDFTTPAGATPHLWFFVTMLILAHVVRSAWPPLVEPTDPALKESILFQRLLRGALTVIPVALGLTGLFGYLYTASTLALRVLETAGFLLLLLLIHQSILRWLLLTQRKLAYQNALDRRAALRQKAKEEKLEEELPGADQMPEVEEPRLDLEAVSKGGRELLNTLIALGAALGCAIIWAEILPAFSMFEQFALWSYTDTQGGQEVQIPVTLFDLGLGILILMLTGLAARRVPALIEFIVLQRLNMTASGHYTVRTLSGYVIVAVGILMALGSIGASWSQIQWMAAALSVGIGFGLQEIVANFISGLIILFERPIRVGDVITVGDTDGVVTKINIRATTIRNWDQKELLVPNKEFITGRLLNWTLSDQTSRIVINVGVSYGSDVEKAMALVLECAKQHPNVMRDPAPFSVFERFDADSLLVSLRCYVARLEHRLPAISDLHLAIYKALAEAGINIAYPQRDVHLHADKPLALRLFRERAPVRSPTPGSDAADPAAEGHPRAGE